MTALQRAQQPRAAGHKHKPAVSEPCKAPRTQRKAPRCFFARAGLQFTLQPCSAGEHSDTRSPAELGWHGAGAL